MKYLAPALVMVIMVKIMSGTGNNGWDSFGRLVKVNQMGIFLQPGAHLDSELRLHDSIIVTVDG